jgi:alkanesulfonate monooxygenase SsuD/methylene tetrahydromethanopterin reductase-like flavin-dependent oxidoreductase (luciferase family)
VCAQLWVGIGATADTASQILRTSQHFNRLQAIRPDKDPNEIERDFAENNLLGDPDSIAERVRQYSQAGVDHLGLNFLAQHFDDVRAQVELFGRTVLASGR